jgi:hypothetical protein
MATNSIKFYLGPQAKGTYIDIEITASGIGANVAVDCQ